MRRRSLCGVQGYGVPDGCPKRGRPVAETSNCRLPTENLLIRFFVLPYACGNVASMSGIPVRKTASCW